ncbi:hypothetical protein DE146DRAFT_467793 [Phaeosphaeria sp. MPI-PUGE-AT-0046c]|nr:hypothetical protein DE146DRAFT_467793 [Phaeosphaeria sp. MPI-PUGE-AT-0046c]
MSGDGPSRLFILPLELREEVYKSALASSAYGTAVLQTCREIHVEARKFLYQRPLVFRDQEVWFMWLNQTPAELLGNVSEMALHVQDVNLKPILETSNYQPSRQSPRLLTAELYQENSDKVKKALILLPNLKRLTIRTPSCRPSHLFCELVTQILASIGPSCPHLSQIRLEGNFRHHTLGFLSTMTNLNSLALEGSSVSSPESTAKILSTLPQLTSLSLISDGAPISSEPTQYRACTTQRYSFNGETLRKVLNLDLLSITENGPSRACFMTKALDALHSHTTLKRLCLRLAYTPDTTIFTSMTKFLERSPIEHLELDWPNVQALELQRHHLLGSNLVTFWVRIESASSALEVLRYLVQSRQERCYQLQEVVLVRSAQLCAEMTRSLDETADDIVYDQDYNELSRARRRLQKMSIHVAWYTEGS